ncbi:MAG: hypothetical protein K6B74_09915, partial [Ruminococcus sp.]|nr:hypothetical protein [Ruminococcus sp.]
KANRMRTEKRSQPQIKNGDILLTMIGLLSLGKSDFENVNEFHKDEEFYKIALGIAYGIPSESSLRNRLDGIGTSMDQQILAGNVDMFLSCDYEPSPLASGCVTVDIDVSPFDNSGSHKTGVSGTYKNFDGYTVNSLYQKGSPPHELAGINIVNAANPFPKTFGLPSLCSICGLINAHLQILKK